jgi:hypothetical protein
LAAIQHGYVLESRLLFTDVFSQVAVKPAFRRNEAAQLPRRRLLANLP